MKMDKYIHIDGLISKFDMNMRTFKSQYWFHCDIKRYLTGDLLIQYINNLEKRTTEPFHYGQKYVDIGIKKINLLKMK